MSGLCPECEERPVSACGLCGPCYKRLIWRPRGGPAVERARATSRAFKENYRGVCIDCGGVTSWPGSHGKPTRCRACNDIVNPIAEIGYRTAKARVADRHARLLEMWQAGATLDEIAADLGSSRSSISVTIHRLRAQGYDLPYRTRTWAGKERSAA